jgi:carboxylate-amine ligase
VIPAPAWADWNAAAAAAPWSVALEEEQMLLEPEGWTPVAYAVALATRPHRTVVGAAAELDGLRGSLDRSLERQGLRAAVAGTHPSAVWEDVAAARRQPTFALHVHVSVPEAEMAVRALDGLRQHLPLLLALSANSPFSQGRDTGLASARIPILAMVPRAPLPGRFGDYRSYVDSVGASRDPSCPGWDARLRPRQGTVEVRIMDAQTRTDDAAALAALVQSLVRLHAEDAGRPDGLTPEALDQNRFLAARDGMAADLVCASGRWREHATDQLAGVLRACGAVARELGCREALRAVAGLAERPGHQRQRAVAREHGLAGVLAELHAEYAPLVSAAAA